MILQELEQYNKIDLSCENLTYFEETSEIELENYTVGYHLVVITEYSHYSSSYLQPEENSIINQETYLSDIEVYDWRRHKVTIESKEYDSIYKELLDKFII